MYLQIMYECYLYVDNCDCGVGAGLCGYVWKHSLYL